MKAHPFNRAAAKAADLLVVVALGALLPSFIGPLAGIAYSLLADSLPFRGFQGQSFGKKLLRLKVVQARGERRPASLKDSVIRNSPIGFAVLFLMIPLWGWIVLLFVGIPLLGLETYLVWTAERGVRLGDAMAETEVIEVEER